MKMVIIQIQGWSNGIYLQNVLAYLFFRASQLVPVFVPNLLVVLKQGPQRKWILIETFETIMFVKAIQ